MRTNDMSEIIDRILSKVGQQKLGATLRESDIGAFEKEHGISLPFDYKEFLLRVGNGGLGPPAYGLLKLGETNKNDVPDYLVNGYSNTLKEEFPLVEHWNWDGMEEQPGFEEKQSKIECGCLALGHDGCGMFWLLIVNGPAKESIWQTSDMGIHPCAPSLTFTQWYENWLDGYTDWWAGYEP